MVILRLLVLLIIGTLIVFAFRFISQLQQINPKAQGEFFPLGVFMTAGYVDQMDVKINDLKAHNLDSIIFNNTGANATETILNTTDQMNFNSVVAFDYDLWNSWWPATVSATIDNARSAIYPLVDRVKNHSSLKGYNVVDEPGLPMKDKLALAVQAFRERDSVHPNMPVLIGEGQVPELFDYSNPDVMLLDVYPVAFHNAPGDLTLNGYIDMVDYIRAASATRPSNKPLWFILQAHDIGDGSESWHLRLPSPEEARMQQWIAMGEGGTGIFWFIYDWDQGSAIGLKNNPTLYNEVSDLARRTVPLKNILLNAHKIQDKIVVTDSRALAYASTLASNDNTKYYIIAVNRSVQDRSITLRPYDLTGQLKDLENNQTYSINSPIPFRAGDGKIFEVLNPVAVSPSPTGPELLKNASFETNDAGSPAQWTWMPGSWDNTVRRTGIASLKVQGPVSNYSDQTVTLKPNTFYTLSGWVKTQNVTGQGIGLRYVQTNPSISTIKNTTRVNGTKDWSEIKISFITPSTYVNGKVDILMDLNTGDQAWVDDVSLCEGVGPCSSGSMTTPTPTPIPTPSPTPVLIVPSPTPTPTPTPSGNGLNATYYNGVNFANLLLSRVDPGINFNWGYGSAAASIPIDQFSVRWTGYIIPMASGNYTFYVRTDDGVRVWVNNIKIIDNWRDQAATERKKSVNLTRGQKYPMKIEYYENTGNASAQLYWSGPGIKKQIIPSGVLYLE